MRIKINFILFIVHLFLGAQVIYAQDLDSLYAVGEYSKILKHFETTPPSSFQDKILKAKTLQAKNFSERAIASYHEALVTRSNQPLHQFTYAKLLKSNNQLKKADSVLTLLTSNYPTNPEFLYQLGLTKTKLNNRSEEIYFEEALKQDPSHQAAAFELSKFYFKIKSYEKAETISLNALKFNPKNKKMLGLLGQIYFTQKELDKALEQFEYLEQLDPPPKFIIEKMALAYANTNQMEKSIEKYKYLLRLEHRNSRYHYLIAQVYAKQGDFKKSEIHAQNAILYKDTSLSSERFTKALAVKENGKVEKAINILKLVIEEAPMFERAYVELALLADKYYVDLNKKLSYFETYENQFENYEYAKFKNLMYRRLTDLRREKHFHSSN